MAEDLVARALTALRNRDFMAARNSIAAYARDNQLEFQHYLIMGLSDLALEDWQAAAATFEEAAALFPHQPQLWFNLGVAQENLGRFAEAIESFEHSLDLKAEQGEACGNLSNLYRRTGLFSAAETMAHRAYELGAPKAQALNALGLALARQGKYEAADKIFREALRLEPQSPHVLANLANTAADRLDFAAAWPLYAAARAVSNEPAIRHEEAMVRLLAGETEIGWPLYESRLERPGALRIKPKAPLWNGQFAAGQKVLLVAEQGFGDAIQFCRYGSLMSGSGAILTWIAPTPLKRLLAQNLPGLVLSEDDPVPETDCWLPLLSLPLALRKLAFAQAPPAPWLTVPAKPELPVLKNPSKTYLRKIGIVWAGSASHERAHERSIPIEMFARVFEQIPGHYYAPFTGPELDDIKPPLPVMRLDHLISDFADTAGLLMQLDWLITVDTAVAHLAGALGVKTCLLLSHCPDWRWGIAGAATPWYPSLTLLRQPKYGDWESVIGALIGVLK
ncbi:MAG: tetratricopeptide repeat protein [Pseudomonadota bacterium]|nr:tetratricopeptide repeat protein [Pseudomonadota bacterium]